MQISTSKKITLLATLRTVGVVTVFGILLHILFFVNRYTRDPGSDLGPVPNPTGKERERLPQRPDMLTIPKTDENVAIINNSRLRGNLVDIDEQYLVVQEKDTYYQARVVTRFVDAQQRLLLIVAFLIVSLGGLSYLVSFYRAKHILKPLTTLTDFVQHLDLHNLHQEVPMQGSATDEISLIANTLQETLNTIDQQAKQLSTFVGHAAHELKTPLMVMQSTLELARKKENRAKIDTISGHITNLASLVDNLLLLSKPEQALPRKEKTHISPLVNHTIEQISTKYPGKKIDVSVSDGLEIKAIPNTVGVILYNLIDNACSHSDADGIVTVTADHKGLTVHNTGSYIPPENREMLWVPFRQAATTTTQHSGLGLALVKTLVSHNKRDISVNSDPKEGTNFTIDRA